MTTQARRDMDYLLLQMDYLLLQKAVVEMRYNQKMTQEIRDIKFPLKAKELEIKVDKMLKLLSEMH